MPFKDKKKLYAAQKRYRQRRKVKDTKLKDLISQLPPEHKAKFDELQRQQTGVNHVNRVTQAKRAREEFAKKTTEVKE